MNTKGPPPRVVEAPPPWHFEPAMLRTAAGNENALTVLRPALAADIGERLRQARGETISRATVAGWLRVHENTVGKIERGETLPDALQLMQLSATLGPPVGWFLGVGEPGPALAVPMATRAVESGDQLFVPLFDVYANPSRELFDLQSSVKDMRSFKTAFVRERLAIKHNHLALVHVLGGSMEPEIHAGEEVLADLEDCSVAVEGPHLVRMDGSLLLKLLQRRPGNRVRVSSRNPEYEPFEVDLGARAADFEVMGRVRWAGVTFR